MDALVDLLDELKKSGLTQGNLLGFLHVLVGRRITKKDGTVVSAGVTWRELGSRLTKARWNTSAVEELGLNAEDLPPRDREKFWYTAIVRAQIGSAKAHAEGDRFAALLRKKGYEVGPAPGG